MKIDVIAHIHAKPGQEAALQQVLESFVDPTRKEDGCLRYDLFVDLDDPTKFTFIEDQPRRPGRPREIRTHRRRTYPLSRTPRPTRLDSGRHTASLTIGLLK
jgi:hypothetical protein